MTEVDKIFEEKLLLDFDNSNSNQYSEEKDIIKLLIDYEDVKIEYNNLCIKNRSKYRNPKIGLIISISVLIIVIICLYNYSQLILFIFFPPIIILPLIFVFVLRFNIDYFVLKKYHYPKSEYEEILLEKKVKEIKSNLTTEINRYLEVTIRDEYFHYTFSRFDYCLYKRIIVSILNLNRDYLNEYILKYKYLVEYLDFFIENKYSEKNYKEFLGGEYLIQSILNFSCNTKFKLDEQWENIINLEVVAKEYIKNYGINFNEATKNVFRISIHGVVISDFIYKLYLKFREKEIAWINSTEVLNYIEECKNLIILINVYSKKNKKKYTTTNRKRVENNLFINELLSSTIDQNNNILQGHSSKIIIRNIDWEKLMQQNVLTGKLGEAIIFAYEKERLINLKLSDKFVVHVAQDYGDGYGYDILSRNENNIPIQIEVKSTKNNQEEDFYFTPNELSQMKQNKTTYYIYRLSNVVEGKCPELKIYASKDFDDMFDLEEIEYRVTMDSYYN